ncbi:MAG: hypothetical protein V4543_10035 [Bacteroidota bacterium]
MKNSRVLVWWCLRTAFFATACLFLPACKPKANENAACFSAIPDSVSFRLHIQPILKTKCALAGCHTGSSPGGNLNLDSALAYAELTNRRSGYTDTISPKTSLLYSTLISVSPTMPPTGRLPDCQIEAFRKWMAQKARNN